MREVNYYRGFYSPNPNDRRGELFTYRSINFDNLNFQADPGKALSVAECKNYEKSVKPDYRMRDNDIHPEYINFIVDTARWHRYIDTQTGMGAAVDAAVAPLPGNNTYDGSITNAGANQVDLDINHNDRQAQRIFGAAGPQITFGNDLAYNGATVVTEVEAILATLYVAIRYNGAAGNAAAQAIHGRKLDAIMNPTIANVNAFWNDIATYMGADITALVVNILGYGNVVNIIGAIPAAEQAQFTNNLQNELTNKITEFYKLKLLQLFNELRGNIPVATARVNIQATLAVGQAADLKAKFDAIRGAHDPFINEIFNVIVGVIGRVYRNSRFYNRRTLADQQIMNWFQKTFNGFDSFPRSIKNFYNAFMGIVKEGDIISRNIEDYINEITQANAGQYRINLKKNNAGIPIFASALPTIPVGRVIWNDINNPLAVLGVGYDVRVMYEFVRTANASPNIVEVSGLGAPGLRIMRSHPEITFSTNVVMFNFDLDGLFKSMLKEAIQESEVQADADDFPDDIGEGDSQFTGRAYYKDGVLMWKDGDVEKPAKDYDGLDKRNKCYTSQIGIDADECTNYIFKCVLATKDDNYLECQRVFARHDIFPKDISVFNKAHPYIMFKTVQKLKFLAKKTVDDKTVINKLESVDDWIKRHTEDVASPVKPLVDVVKDNVDAQNYLKNIVNYFNANPQILNKNYSKGNAKLGEINNQDPYGLKFPRKTLTDMSLPQLGTIINNTNRNLFIKSGPLGYMLGSFPFGMMGGSAIFNSKNIPRGWKNLQNLLKTYKTKLATYNKTLSPNTDRKLQAKIDDVKKYEETAIKYLNYIKEYNDINEKLGDYTNDTSLSFKELQNVVDNNYNTLITKKSHKEGQIVAAFNALRDAIVSEGTKAGDKDPLGNIQHTPIVLDQFESVFH